MLASLLVAFSVLIPARCLTDLSSEYTHHAVLDPKELMKLYWTVDWDKETIAFAVEAETTGWVGFGLSSGNGKMVGSDVVIGWVKDNTGYLTDRYADDRSLPRVDEEQNYILTGAEESDKKTVLKFKRKFDTCDPRDRKIKRGTTKVVFAYHTEDPTSENDIKQHTFRGSRSILLLNSMDKQKRIDETGWNTYVFQARNVSVPKRETTYWCTLVKAPPINTKHHVTKFEPYIQEGNEGLVHHMILYECHGNFNDSHRGPGYNCRDQANMPLQLCFYYSVLAAWAVGGQAFYYPTKAGFPIGIADSPKNYMIEIHYNNPEGIEGRTDSSGFRFYYTSKLRQYDAGIFAVGDANTNFLVIPPKQESWLSAGYCSKECNQHLMRASKLTEGGINVFASFLHTHLQGRAVWTKHFRDGVELPEIVRDDNYDFNFQDMQVLRKEVLIKPGDDLVHYCKFQTMDREDLVVGGDATTNEMCVDFLFYYPRIANATSFCTSTLYDPVYSFIQKYFPAVSVPWPNPLANMKVNWTKDMVSDLRRRLDEAKTLLPSCLAAPGRNQFPPPLPVPKITKLLPPTESKCPKPIPEDPDNLNSSSLVSASCIVVLFSFVGSIMFL